MSHARTFETALSEALNRLSSDEWAVTEARDKATEGLTPAAAFHSIVGILRLASRQTDSYALSSCCWLAVDLMTLSNTAEAPLGLIEAVETLTTTASALGCEHEVKPIRTWYRLAA